jgi:enamine deaminase RidA (YjgF/YER057c/UK114 family)
MNSCRYASVRGLGPLAGARGLVCLSLLMGTRAWTAEVERIPYPADENRPESIVSIVTVNDLVFPSAVEGRSGSALEQVDEAVGRLDARLRELGLTIGNMLQHTIYLKDGTASPIDVIQRFHRAARALAPSLLEYPSVGTIVRVPRFASENTAVMLDIVAATPRAGAEPDGFTRIPFAFGPEEIAETIGDDTFVFTAGMEAMDFEHGTLAGEPETQVAHVVEKIDTALRRRGSSIANMISYNLYVQSGTDASHVARLFRAEAESRAPELAEHPSAATLIVVDGMALDGFRLEVDAVAVLQQTNVSRAGEHALPEGSAGRPVASISVGDLVFFPGIGAADAQAETAVPEDILGQVEATVRRLHSAMRAADLSLSDIVKLELYLRDDAADVEQVLAKFYEVAASLDVELPGKPSARATIVSRGFENDTELFQLSVIAARQ